MSASTSTTAPSAPPLTSVLFARGVIARLTIWPALRVAVAENWGGSAGAEKRTWLASELVDAFERENPPPDVTYVEDMLLQVMEDEFETVLEDSSAEAVAKDIVTMWDAVQGGDSELVAKFEMHEEKTKGKKIQVEEAAGDEDDWSDESGSDDGDDGDDAPMLVDSQQTKTHKQEPEVDEDGFTVVKGKGTRHG
ncbi:Pre-rRNA-processing protein TSR2-domain-containing protein [Fomitopsis betulina]|nr:Pre-rRNA-processing protein TSR2-domain-containing protein [Fomitopsis betulina]